MRKIWLNIKLFFMSLAWGMKGADKLISTSNKESEGSDLAGIEQHKESESVYADLLRGEVTQEVKELRHEMYYSERKSHEYVYTDNGHAVKKNNIFEFSGNVENSENLKIQIVQENKEDPSSLMENDIFCIGENAEYDNKKDYRLKDKRDFTIMIKRDFIPSFRLEQYATKIVVKRINESKAQLDIYVSQYQKQFDNNSKMFCKGIDKIYMGDKRNDIVDFKQLNFISCNAYGTDDLKGYSYDNIEFIDIVNFDGSYVLKFLADIKDDGIDLISEFYDETAAKKSENHEMRKGAVLDISNVIESNGEEKYDVDQAIKLAEELTDER